MLRVESFFFFHPHYKLVKNANKLSLPNFFFPLRSVFIISLFTHFKHKFLFPIIHEKKKKRKVNHRITEIIK